MSDENDDLFEELTEFSDRLKEDEAYYGYPYNKNNPRFNLNLVSSATLDELVDDMIKILATAAEYRADGWELTEPIHFGKIQLHRVDDGTPRWRDIQSE